ncbi:Rhodanese-like/PpiC domain-containing protein 12 [Hibiscus syriacus]|uniref:Peptidyl-prolyl cis-trans isomerase n=1 Tax=Hibiscus syriacus TaxID=106335 RepID=A0A6A2ZJ65_HIBSY|nr:Rhodanese-like/PpiC domain-containing protein 12 [Hibiscus syriacus]
MLRASRFGRIASSLTNLVDLRRSLIPISLLFILIINLFTKSSLFLHFTLSSPLHLLLSAKPLPMRIIHNSDFQHLLLKEDGQKLLEELQQRIAGGRDLADLAVEYSICPSKEKGGMLGWVRKGQMVPEFEEAAFSAPLNKVVKCKTNFGWHLLQVLSEREESLLKDIEPEEFHAKLQDPSFIEQAQLIDVREPEEVISYTIIVIEVSYLKFSSGSITNTMGIFQKPLSGLGVFPKNEDDGHVSIFFTWKVPSIFAGIPCSSSTPVSPWQAIVAGCQVVTYSDSLSGDSS